MAVKQNKRKYTLEEIEVLVNKSVSFWRYDKSEDVYMNCWSVSNSAQFGIFPKPSFKKEKDARDFFREHLKTYFLKTE